jgi:hypothetical protein
MPHARSLTTRRRAVALALNASVARFTLAGVAAQDGKRSRPTITKQGLGGCGRFSSRRRRCASSTAWGRR